MTDSFTFYKMHGTGNDFIIIDGREGKEKYLTDEYFKSISKKIANRNFGIGCDQILLIRDSDIGDFKMIIFNSDGSSSPMCGNGIRCCSLFVYKYANNIIDKKDLIVETTSIVVNVSIIHNDENDYLVKVNMGTPKVLDNQLMVKTKDEHNNDIIFESYSISFGNPHCITFLNDHSGYKIESFNVNHFGPQIENNLELFPEKTNVEFIEIIDNENILMRVWERGCGETLSCGSGACAAGAATILKYKSSNYVNIKLKGGELLIEWDPETNSKGEYVNPLYMTGKATFVFKGEYFNLF